MHALIIEDQALIAMMLEDELCVLGFTSCDVATTQESAIAAARRRCPDLITADDHLPTGSGIEAVRIICSEQSIPTVYIVGDPQELRQRLPDTIIVGKPFMADELREAVQRATIMGGTSRELADPNYVPIGAPVSADRIEMLV